MKRITSIALAFMLVALLLPAGALAAGALNGPAADRSADGRLIISQSGRYTLTGSMRGTVWVDPGAGEVELILDNVSLNGAGAPAIQAVSGDRLTVTMAPDSRNTLTDGNASNAMNAAVFSQIPMNFGGNGHLNINGVSGQGIRTIKGEISFSSGWYNISAPDQCISAPEPIRMEQGVTMFQNGRQTAGIIPEDTGMVSAFSQQPASESLPGMNGTVPQLPLQDQSGAAPYPQQPSGENLPEMNGTDPRLPSQNQSSAAPAYPQQSAGESLPGMNGQTPPEMNGTAPQLPSQQNSAASSAGSPTEIVTSSVMNSAADLEPDMASAQTITVTDEDSQVKITSSGTYVVTGSSSNGNITVKKGATGVVLVLENLDLTSTTGATLSVNKEAEVKLIVSGNVVLTDAENPEDENSADEAVADAFDGAAIKIKAGSKVCLTGDGTLTVNGNAKNGIKTGDEANLLISGGLNVNISAANDGINANYDLTILDGTLTIEAGDDAIHADHILTIGNEDGTGPVINVTGSNEGLEGTVINMFGGAVTIRSKDDAVNAANGDGLYEGELDYSFNMTGGRLTIRSSGDGIDSNGHVNLIGGTVAIQSASAGGEAGIDYDGSMYVAQNFEMNNQSGTAGPDGMGGQMTAGMPQMNGQFSAMANQASGMQQPQVNSQNINSQFGNGQLSAQGSNAQMHTDSQFSRMPQSGLRQNSGFGQQNAAMRQPGGMDF